MNPELLYTLIKESLTNISPRLLVQLTQDSSNHRTQCQQEPLHLRSQEGEKGKTNASSLIRSADFPIRASHRGSKVVPAVVACIFIASSLDQGGSRYVSQKRYGGVFLGGLTMENLEVEAH